MQGKTCLITGATAGIGLVTARELARLGARVVIVGRSAERLAAAVAHIQGETRGVVVESLLADLSAQAEVRRLAGEVRERYDRIDVLINNAGAMFLKRRESVDGIEMTFALNHLSYFLLTNLLVPLLQASAPARVVNVASAAHRGGKIEFDDLEGKTRYGGWKAYQQSKLANILFSFELARRLDGTGVTVNCLHPGFVRTNFLQVFDGGRGGRLLRAIADRIAISPEQGARTSIYLASAPEVASVSGRYFEKERAVASAPRSLDPVSAERLWQISSEMTGLVAAGAGSHAL